MELIGRTEHIDALWRTFDRASVLLTGPRRMGKTSLLRALEAQPRPGWVALFIDLQGARSVDEPASRWRDALPAQARAEAEGASLGARAAGAALNLGDGATRDAWGDIQRLISTHLSWHNEEHRLVVLLDELPWWLDDLESGGAGEARAALANLRRLRGALGDRLRMVYTGSVGLSGLAADLGASAEINDLHVVSLPPLELAAGMTLFERDVVASGRTLGDREAAKDAHLVSGGIPYWIEEVAARAATIRAREPVDRDVVAAAVEGLLSPMMRHGFQDEAAGHFLRRSAPHVDVIRAVLEAAARAEAVEEEVLLSAAVTARPGLSRGAARELLYRLHDAWYLVPAEGGAAPKWRWLNPLMRLWWVRHGETAL
jgi:hypothetical protein